MLHLITYTAFFFFNDTATTEIYTLSLHDALPIFASPHATTPCLRTRGPVAGATKTLPAAGRNTASAPQLERASHQGPDFQIQKSRTRWRALDRLGGGTGEPARVCD